MTVGVFDSGIGGLTALFALHRMLPGIDCLYFADRKNAPYGEKSPEELKTLVTNDIDRLRKAGADRVLIACCTASTVFDVLSADARMIALPILRPTVKTALRLSERRKIGLLCTEATARSHAFDRAIAEEDGRAELITLPTQNFVTLTESGVSDASVTDASAREIERTLSPLFSSGIDTLILGCTHFSHLRKTISSFFPGVRTVCSALCGAEEMARIIGRQNGTGRSGSLTYLD